LRFQRRSGRDRGRDRVLDQVDVAVVFFDGDLDEDGVGVEELVAGLVEEARGGGEAREDVAEADVPGRVLVGEGLEECPAEQFDVDGGVVPVILDTVVFEQLERDLVVDKLPVGGVLGAERDERNLAAEALAEFGIRTAQVGDAGGADVVEQGIERDGLAGFGVEVLVIPGLRGIGRGERQRLVNELFTELGELGVGVGGGLGDEGGGD